MSDYEQVIYPGAAYPQSHPERMATAARLFGLQPADIESCRVLELGCGSGENLLPLALQFPQAHFHGIDLSPAHVRLATASIAELGLRNLRVEQGDIATLPGRLPEFDYVIAHGVYSWVPAPVRDALLAACRQCLAPHGVVYISHNVYPGWRVRGIVRDALLFHLQGVDDPRERLDQARALLDFMCAAIPEGGNRNVYADVVAALGSDERLRSYLLHDLLEQTNEPTYFTDFVAHAHQHRLRFLAEADLPDMSPDLLGEQVAGTLAGIGDDAVKREQYLDFLRNRSFRQTLLCRGDAQPAAVAQVAAIADLCVACAPTRQKATDDGSVERLEVLDAIDNVRVVGPPLVRAALRVAADRWPRAVPCRELAVAARARLAAGRVVVQTTQEYEHEEQIVHQHLLDLALLGAIELFTRSPPVVAEVSERPRTSAWARYRIARGLPFCNLRNESMVFADFTLALLVLLDGEHGKPELVEGLMQVIARDELVVCEEGAAGARRSPASRRHRTAPGRAIVDARR